MLGGTTAKPTRGPPKAGKRASLQGIRMVQQVEPPDKKPNNRSNTTGMKINIKSKNLELTLPMRAYIEEKVGGIAKWIKRYDNDNSALANVEIARTTNHHHKGEVYYAEITLPLPDRVLRAEVTDVEIHSAVNKARDIIKRELRKYKTARIFRFKRRRR